MIRARRHSKGFRFAGTLVLLALVPSFAPDTWGLSCIHHASHEAADEHESAEPRPHHAAAPAHERGHHAAEAKEAPGRGHHPGAAPAYRAQASDHGSGHHDPEAPPCTCAGECSTSAGPPSPVPAGVFELPPAYPESRRLSRASGAPAADRTPYILPFANAPPLS